MKPSGQFSREPAIVNVELSDEIAKASSFLARN